ncbi:hemerythrin domain-containing protein [Geodermatophilus sp. SYSU D01062]
MTATAPLPFPVTPRRPGDPEADVTRLALAHRALCAGCRLLAGVAAEAAAGAVWTAERRRAVVAFGRCVLREVRAHTAREDAVLWPVVAASAGTHAADLEPLTEDHAVLRAVLGRADAALTAFAATAAGPDAAAPLAAVLAELADALDEHVAEEEREVFPVIRRCVSVRDLARYEGVCARASGPRSAAFALPWVADACRTPGERAGLLGATSPLLRVLLRAAEPGWRRRRDLVAGR